MMFRLALVSLVALAAVAGCKKAPAASKPTAGTAAPAIPVDAAMAVADTVIDAIAATGQIEPLQQIELRPDIEGRISELQELRRQAYAGGSGTGSYRPWP